MQIGQLPTSSTFPFFVDHFHKYFYSPCFWCAVLLLQHFVKDLYHTFFRRFVACFDVFGRIPLLSLALPAIDDLLYRRIDETPAKDASHNEGFNCGREPRSTRVLEIGCPSIQLRVSTCTLGRLLLEIEDKLGMVSFLALVLSGRARLRDDSAGRVRSCSPAEQAQSVSFFPVHLRT